MLPGQFELLQAHQNGDITLPGCVAKSCRFSAGVWGWRRFRSTLLSRPQPSAAVLTCSRCGRYDRASGELGVSSVT